jgi:hypothetical protein
MNTSNTLAIARASAIVVAFALASCAADELTTEQQIAALAPAPPTMSAVSGSEQPPCTGRQSHALLLEDSDGKQFQLVYVLGCGWKQMSAGKTGDAGVARPAMSLTPISASHAETPAATSADPMAVFIDGPTGYTFAWTAEGGWKFVGYLSDAAR